MKLAVRTLCILVYLVITACATIPPTPQKAITLPVSFNDVWFRSTLAQPLLLVMTDTGTVIVSSNCISFAGEKSHVDIDYSKIQKVSFEKFGMDLINNWVTIKYERDNMESFALLTGGKALGWGGAGVAAEIFQTLDSALQQKGLSSVVQRK